MLDDIQRRPLFVEPARKDPLPAFVDLQHIHLDERPGIMVGFPGGGLFASPQAQNDVADANRFAGFQGHITGNPVTLVEQPQHRDPFCHRRRPTRRVLVCRQINRDDIRAGLCLIQRRCALRLDSPGHGWMRTLIKAGTNKKRNPQQQHARPGDQPSVHPSGVQAS
jgi:hypothetical protein